MSAISRLSIRIKNWDVVHLDSKEHSLTVEFSIYINPYPANVENMLNF
jgi:hypothetical protein